MSSILLATLLSLVQTNGTVAPAFKHTTVCDINAAEVLTGTYGPTIDFPHTMHKQTKYNSEIRNSAVLQSLIMDVQSQVNELPLGPTPIGGSRTLYTATIPGTQTKLELKSLAGSNVYFNNPSRSAQKLVRFINLNCK